ncbi:MAG: hypothetical protein F4Z02_09345 [Acidimicrobiia bacterium]|nr:hypothetical protein [Acidimicrobiia bacterium]MYG71337.1 hypothetical protein [Acidimicrobiia bacterium]
MHFGVVQCSFVLMNPSPEAESRSESMLTTSLLEEGLKTREFPGVVYRSGPTGRRAGLVGGPDVWEIIRDLRGLSGRGMERIERLAEELELSVSMVGLAADFYSAFPEEIDARIEANELAAEQIRRPDRRD